MNHHHPSADHSTFLVGAAETEITPTLGTHLNGDLCHFRPATEILDPLYARALVVTCPSQGEAGRVCYLSMDLLGINNEWVRRIRQAIHERSGLRPEAVMIHCTQNHSAPGLGPFVFQPHSRFVRDDCWWLHCVDPAYADFLLPALVELAQRACQALQPATLVHANWMDSRIGFNRRYVKRNGTVQTLPRTQDIPDILHVDGPTDPEVALACFYDASQRMVAALLHHTCHPATHFGTGKVTASWPGAWCRKFRDRFGAPCVPLMVNGCCGNINARDLLNPGPQADDDTLGDWLMQSTASALQRGREAQSNHVDCRQRFIPIRRAALDQEEVAYARDYLAEHPEPVWKNDARDFVDPEWVFNALLVDLAEQFAREPTYTYEAQAFRLGPVSVVGLIGEPFAQGQLEIKLKSPAPRSLVAHMCNGYVGYLPPRDCYEKFNYNYYTADGHPVRRGATRFMLEPAAWDLVRDTTLQLLGQMWNQD